MFNMLGFNKDDVELLNEQNIYILFENKNIQYNKIYLTLLFFGKISIINYLIAYKTTLKIKNVKMYIHSVKTLDSGKNITFAIGEANNKINLI